MSRSGHGAFKEVIKIKALSAGLYPICYHQKRWGHRDLWLSYEEPGRAEPPTTQGEVSEEYNHSDTLVLDF